MEAFKNEEYGWVWVTQEERNLLGFFSNKDKDIMERIARKNTNKTKPNMEIDG